MFSPFPTEKGTCHHVWLHLRRMPGDAVSRKRRRKRLLSLLLLMCCAFSFCRGGITSLIFFAKYVFSYSEMPPVAVNPNAQHIVIDGKEYVFNSCLCGLNTEEFIRLNEWETVLTFDLSFELNNNLSSFPSSFIKNIRVPKFKIRITFFLQQRKSAGKERRQR